MGNSVQPPLWGHEPRKGCAVMGGGDGPRNYEGGAEMGGGGACKLCHLCHRWGSHMGPRIP
eukprot:6216670-Pyramimonas_sp.AAC.1